MIVKVKKPIKKVYDTDPLKSVENTAIRGIGRYDLLVSVPETNISGKLNTHLEVVFI